MLATGNSQLVFLAELVDAHRRRLDARSPRSTWTSTSGWPPTIRRASSATCANASPTTLPLREFHYLDGTADPEAEARRYAALLRAHPLDLCCAGIGENGHLAFNDPPVADFDDPHDVKVVALEDASRRQQVDEGHFATIDDVPTHAITVTIPALLARRPRPRHRARGPQGRAGAGDARSPSLDRLPGVDPAHPTARDPLPRHRLGGARVGSDLVPRQRMHFEAQRGDHSRPASNTFPDPLREVAQVG